MLRHTLIALLAVATAAGLPEPTAPSVKPGLWEVTITSHKSPTIIPPDQLAKMSPEQQAKTQAMVKNMDERNSHERVLKSCVSTGDFAKGFAMLQQMPNCTANIVTSTRSKLEIHMACGKGAVVSVREVQDFEHVTGFDDISSVDATMAHNSHTVLSAKWIGPTC